MPVIQTERFDVNKAIEHLRTKWVGNPCPMCRVTNWSVQESIFQLLQFNRGTLVLGVPFSRSFL